MDDQKGGLGTMLASQQ